VNRPSFANQSVELLEGLATHAHLLLVSDETHLVPARARFEAELLFEDAECVLALPVERSGQLVVIEDEGLASAGVVSGQW
jgi:hypothetical protein